MDAEADRIDAAPQTILAALDGRPPPADAPADRAPAGTTPG
jgi:hypothetical protein